jgi:hypothetical protein
MASSKRTLDIDELTYQNLYLKAQSSEQISSYTIPVIPGGSNIYKKFQYFTPEQVLSTANISFTPSTIPDILASISTLSSNQLSLARGISSLSTSVAIDISTNLTVIQEYSTLSHAYTYPSSYADVIQGNNLLRGQNIQTLNLQRTIVTLGNSISTLSSQFNPLFDNFNSNIQVYFNQGPSVSTFSTYFTDYYSNISTSIVNYSTSISYTISTNIGEDASTLIGYNLSIDDIIQSASASGVSTLSTLINSTLIGFNEEIQSYDPTVGIYDISTNVYVALSSLSSLYIRERGIPGICSISTNMTTLYLTSIVNAQATAGTPGLCTMSTYLTGINDLISSYIGISGGDTISTFSTSLYNQIDVMNSAICTVGYSYVILQQEAIGKSLSTLSTSFGYNYNNIATFSSFSTLIPSIYSTINTVFSLESPFLTLQTLSTLNGSNVSTLKSYISTVYPSIYSGPGLSSLSSFINPNFSSISTSLTTIFSSFSNSVNNISSVRTDPGVSSLSTFINTAMLPYFNQYNILNNSVITISFNNRQLITQYNQLSADNTEAFTNLNPANSITELNNTIVSFSNYVNTNLANQVSQTSNLSTFVSTNIVALYSSYNSVKGPFYSTLGYLVSSYTAVSSVVEFNLYSPSFSSFTTDILTTNRLVINSGLSASTIGIRATPTADYSFSMKGGAQLISPSQPAINHILVGSNLAGKTTFINSNTDYSYIASPSDPGFTVRANDIAYNGRIWVIVGETTGSPIKWSADPLLGWNNATVPPKPVGSPVPYAVNCIKWSGTYWLAGTSDIYINLLSSPDGKTWTDVSPLNTMDSIKSLAWNGLSWVSVGSGTSNIQYTTPTGTWTLATNTFTGQGNAVTTNGRTWIAVGLGDKTIKYSYNQASWTDVTGPQLSTAQAVAWNGDKFVAGGSNGNSSNLMYSYTGVDWTYVPISPISTINAIIWDGSRWNLTGTAGSLQQYMTSSDAIVWTTITTAVTTGQIKSIGYASNTVPTIQLSNFDIYSGEVPALMNSKHRMNIIQSTIYFNDGILSIRRDNSIINQGKIGINTTYPEYALDIGIGNARKPAGTNWVTASDSRVKLNIKTVDLLSCAKLISEIPLRTYSFIKEFQEKAGVGSNSQYGFIAQEVKTVLPNTVSYTNEHGLADFHSLDTDQVFKLEFGATQYLLNTIQKLESQVSTLEAKYK